VVLLWLCGSPGLVCLMRGRRQRLSLRPLTKRCSNVLMNDACASSPSCAACFLWCSSAANESNSQPRSTGAVFKLRSSLLTAVHASLLQADGCFEDVSVGLGATPGPGYATFCRGAHRSARHPLDARARALTKAIVKHASLQVAPPHAASSLQSPGPLQRRRTRERERCPQQAH
jgi:hypothetical protein